MNRWFCLYIIITRVIYLRLLRKNISQSGPLKMQSRCNTGCLCVSMSGCDLGYVFSSGLGIMESSLFSFFLLLCLASCSHHLAPGFEKQAKSLPPEWHENIPTHTQPSCHSLSSQPQTTSKDNRVAVLNGILKNLNGQ